MCGENPEHESPHCKQGWPSSTSVIRTPCDQTNQKDSVQFRSPGVVFQKKKKKKKEKQNPISHRLPRSDPVLIAKHGERFGSRFANVNRPGRRRSIETRRGARLSSNGERASRPPSTVKYKMKRENKGRERKRVKDEDKGYRGE